MKKVEAFQIIPSLQGTENGARLLDGLAPYLYTTQAQRLRYLCLNRGDSNLPSSLPRQPFHVNI